MSYEFCNYMVDGNNIRPREVVSIPVTLFESMLGKYFVGQTGNLQVGNGSSAWAGLVNPCDSRVDLFANVFTVSNFSEDYMTAEIWLNTNFPEKGIVSHKVSPTNTAIKPLPKNKVDILFLRSTIFTPENGVNVYKRIIPPNTTLVGEEDGKFIEAPGGSYVIFLNSSSSKPQKAIVAFGWWEKPK